MIPLTEIERTHERIAPYIKRTRLETNTTLSRELGAQVYLKLELFQKTGSFKPRGAFNQILNIPEERRSRGVVGVSGGNFAQGLAYAGSVLGVPTRIIMPDYTPRNYLDATRGYGAEIILVPSIAQAFAQADSDAAQGWNLTHPYDDPYQVMGCGTIGLEIIQDLPDVTDIFVSIGGGGLLSGIITIFAQKMPGVRVWGVETEGSDAMGQALAAGKVVPITPTSLARTLGAPYVSEYALQMMQMHAGRYVRVSDREAFADEIFLLEHAKLLTELATSCTIAAARKVKAHFQPESKIVFVICGGNASLENLIEYRRLLAE